MSDQHCQRCHQTANNVLLRQSDDLLCDNCHYERPPSFFKGVEEEQLEDRNQDHSFRFLSLALPHSYYWLYLTVIIYLTVILVITGFTSQLLLALPHSYYWLYLTVITGKEAEPDADYCQQLADNRFTPCFDVHPDLGTNSADLGPLEIGGHGTNSQDSGQLENDFSTSSRDFQMKNIEVSEPQTSSENTEAATYENNTPSSHNLVGNKISKLGHKQTGPHPESSTNQAWTQGIPRLTISKDQTNNSYYSNFHNVSSLLTFTICPRSGKENFKFHGSYMELDLIEKEIKLDGIWKPTKDPNNHKIFKFDIASISWWDSTKTISVSGKSETDIRDQLKQLIPKTKTDPSVRSPQSEPTKKAVKPSPLGTDHQQELKNLSAAIHTLFNNSIEAGSEVFNLLKQEKETNEKLNQEIRSLISENNSIKFENLTLKAKVTELRNTIDAYSDQIDNEWERPKKTCHAKTWVPPT